MGIDFSDCGSAEWVEADRSWKYEATLVLRCGCGGTQMVSGGQQEFGWCQTVVDYGFLLTGAYIFRGFLRLKLCPISAVSPQADRRHSHVYCCFSGSSLTAQRRKLKFLNILRKLAFGSRKLATWPLQTLCNQTSKQVSQPERFWALNTGDWWFWVILLPGRLVQLCRRLTSLYQSLLGRPQVGIWPQSECVCACVYYTVQRPI